MGIAGWSEGSEPSSHWSEGNSEGSEPNSEGSEPFGEGSGGNSEGSEAWAQPSRGILQSLEPSRVGHVGTRLFALGFVLPAQRLATAATIAPTKGDTPKGTELGCQRRWRPEQDRHSTGFFTLP